MNKISKGKAVGLLSLGLASVALGSVGFAAWVVSGTTLTNPENVSVTVGDIIDNRITVTAALNETNKTVNLDADSTLHQGDLKISAASGSTQDLTFKIDVNVKANDTTYAGGQKSFVFATAFPDGTSDYVALDKIEDESAAKLSDNTFAVTPNTTGVSKSFVFTLKWGSAFNGKNPVELSTSDNKAVNDVIAALKDLKTKMAAGIKVTLSEVTA